MLEWKPGMTLREAEAEIIIDCFKKNNFNKMKTARELGISIRCLTNRFKGSKRHPKLPSKGVLMVEDSLKNGTI